MHVKNLKASLFVFLLLSVIAESSIAAEWNYIASKDGINVFVELPSLRRTGSKVKVWIKEVLPEPQKIIGSHEQYQSTLSLHRYDCEEGTDNPIKSIYFVDKDAISTIVWSSDKYPPSLTLDIEPKSLPDFIFHFVCSRN